MRTLAVTGGTGFLGQHLLRMALASGYDVRALTRGWKPPEDEISWVDGALDRPDSLVKLASGADAVVHVAGLINGRNRAAFESVNVAGTTNMIDAARKAGVRRFIHISSLAAREPELSSYGWSKCRSEKLVAASGLDWTIIRPPAIYGPGDRETLELFKMARRGFVALPPPGRFSIIHVEDLCRLILAILDEPDSWAEIYEPDDGRAQGWDNRHFARSLGRIFGKRTATLAMPKPILRIAAGIDRIFRRDAAKLTPDRVGYFCHPDWVVTPGRIPATDLWTPRIRTATGLKQTAQWYHDNGWLRL
ncbi:NAD-dependent epimerase/dehydratase family protein [Sphingosinicella rhizophila]|uniref:NAD-dependent epimerase/dehydratase family protein n=1 Tax=Sphingosinicella rhizophila TaxID=3050082 RepID=A0ABU3Q5K5_9SPHN|nr:NAD-dependent epimerase/dehydratase family protein [Sphingosinicella sp. GR2756]MDT9598577.1 NAD-dependent epimerase/dehydratase family protein [Sphingosinicella sp. GR2756]